VSPVEGLTTTTFEPHAAATAARATAIDMTTAARTRVDVRMPARVSRLVGKFDILKRSVHVRGSYQLRALYRASAGLSTRGSGGQALVGMGPCQ
jgi:hypothetical protein